MLADGDGEAAGEEDGEEDGEVASDDMVNLGKRKRDDGISCNVLCRRFSGTSGKTLFPHVLTVLSNSPHGNEWFLVVSGLVDLLENPTPIQYTFLIPFSVLFRVL